MYYREYFFSKGIEFKIKFHLGKNKNIFMTVNLFFNTDLEVLHDEIRKLKEINLKS